MMCKSIAVLLLVSSGLFAQINSEQYNKLVNEAELAIIAGNYLSAIRAYESAFNQDMQPFNSDLYNAANCFLKAGQWQNGKKYLNKLARRGVPLKELTDRAFQSLTSNQEWEQYTFLYGQFYEKAAPTPSVKFVGDYIKQAVILHDSLSFYGVNYSINFVGDTMLRTTERAGEILNVEKRWRQGETVHVESKDKPIKEYEKTPDELRIGKKIKTSNEVAQRQFKAYVAANGWPDEKAAGVGELNYGTSDFYTNVSTMFGYTTMIFKSTIFKNREVSVTTSIHTSDGDSLPGKKDDWLSGTVIDAVQNGRLPSTVGFSFLYPDVVNDYPKQDYVMLRINPEAECRELGEKHNGKRMSVATFPENIEERFLIAQKQLHLPTRDEMNRKFIFVHTHDTDFVFSINRREQEMSLTSCYTIEEFLATAKVIE